jgi:hypothetical protein
MQTIKGVKYPDLLAAIEGSFQAWTGQMQKTVSVSNKLSSQ